MIVIGTLKPLKIGSAKKVGTAKRLQRFQRYLQRMDFEMGATTSMKVLALPRLLFGY